VTDKEYDLMRYRGSIRSMHRLMRLNAPPVIKAHWFVKVLLPRMIKVLGIVPEVGEQMADMISRGLALYSGTCVICKRVPAVYGDDCCAKCQAECDQLLAEMDEGEDTEDKEPHGVD
jgi:hypothetical protein